MPYRGTTICIENTLTDFDGSPLVPDGQDIHIYDPDNADKGAQSPVQKDTNVFGIYYTIPEDGKEGTWKCIWKATKGTYSKVGIFTFDVSAP